MAEQFNGKVRIRTSSDDTTILLSGNNGKVEVGGNGESGSVTVKTATGEDRVRAVERGLVVYDDTGQPAIQLRGVDGEVRIGADGNGGELSLENASGTKTVYLGGGAASLELGATGQAGDVSVRDGENVETIHLGGGRARIDVGAVGRDGDIYLRNDQGVDTVHLGGTDARLELGASGQDGDIFVKDDQGVTTIHLNGQSGDIILENADAAEEFDVADGQLVEPGTVVVLGDDASLMPSTREYDRRVVGVISGAGTLRPGIILGRRPSHEARRAVALIGTVYCRVDATAGPVAVGDLLTTSTLAGHAMKAADPNRSFGAILGKSLGALMSGTGFLPVLVALQ